MAHGSHHSPIDVNSLRHMLSTRVARRSDIDAIVGFTTGTFEWGDYVPVAIGSWIDDPNGVVMVAVDDDDKPIALGRAVMLSPTEAWLHGARVDPEHRGQGIAGEMAVVLTDWTKGNGALVTRLMIEDSNGASRRHIAKTGFRRTATVHRGYRDLAAGESGVTGNGRPRRRSPLVARPGRRSEADIIVASWLASESGRSLRGLVARGWTFHRLNADDIRDTSDGTMVWDVGGATVLSREVDGSFDIDLLDASESDADDILSAMVDVAIDHGASHFSVWGADYDWILAAFTRNGCESFPSGIYALSS